MRVVFMGTPHFSVPALTALLDSPLHEVVAVYSQPPRPAGRGMKLTASPVQTLAEARGIPVFTPTSLKSPEAQQEFAAHGADVAVVAAYGLLLPQAILDAPRFGCINIHPSDLPRWRGAAPIQRTIMAGDATTACCIMQMDAGLDTGPVLMREHYTLSDGTFTGMLHDFMAERGAQMTLAVLDALANGTAQATPQTNEGATYAAKLTKTDQWLDFTKNAYALRQHVLAMMPVPAALTILRGEPIKIFAVQVEAGDANQPTGYALDDALLINCADGTALRLLELQRQNKARQPLAAFVQGFPVPAGSQAELPKL